MDVKYFLQRVLKSGVYSRSKALARDYLTHPERLNDLVSLAEKKSSTTDKKSALAECRNSIAAACRLIKAYAAGRYKEIPWDSLAMIAASLLYFIMPFDVVPDIILALGFVDDAALLAWTFKAVKGDIDRFVEWEREYSEVGAENSEGDAGANAGTPGSQPLDSALDSEKAELSTRHAADHASDTLGK